MTIKYEIPQTIEVQDDGYKKSADVETIDFGDNLIVSTNYDADGYCKVRVDAYGSEGDGDSYCLQSGWDGKANPGRYLEFFKNNDSFQMPYPTRKDGTITDITYVGRKIDTGALEIKVNTTTVYTLVITASKKVIVNNLNLALNADDDLSVRVSSGKLNRPTLFIFVEDS